MNSCPKCGAPLKKTGHSYGRHLVKKERFAQNAFEIEVLLDNIRSIYNVGSIFRTAVSAGISKLHLCGITATPENPRLAKTALGAEEFIAWQYHTNALYAAKSLHDEDFSLWAIEGGEEAKSLFSLKPPQNKQKILLIIGNELAGIDPEVMKISERILYIPMQGGKESLNLTVAFGIVAYFLRYL